MAIKIGTSDVTAIYNGTSVVSKIYIGSSVAYEPGGGAPDLPATIANLTATAASTTTVQLAFTNSPTAASYEYRLNGGAAVALAANRIVTGLTPNTAYTFEVRGVNVTGSGLWSNVANATTNMDLPGTISNLSATAPSTTSVQLVYTNSANATSHQYRQNGGAATAVPGDKLITGLTANTAYTYEVRGVNAAGNGSWSNLFEVTTPMELPGATGALTSAALSSTEVQLTFTDASNTSSHQYRIGGGTAVTLAGNKIVSGLTANTAYAFEVRGVNSAGQGIWSNVSNVTTDAVVNRGPELVDFVSGSWTMNGTPLPVKDAGGITWSGASNTAGAFQGIDTEDNVDYEVIITIDNYSLGSLRAIVYGETTAHGGATSPNMAANGTYTFAVNTSGSGTANNRILLQATGTTGVGNTYRVTSVSVKKILA